MDAYLTFVMFCGLTFCYVVEAESLNCSEPAPVANAYRFWEGGAAGSYVTYSCLFSYVHTSGDLVRVCNSTNGNYSGESPVCILECGVPADVVGASRVYSNVTTQGSDVNYTCWEDYEQFVFYNRRVCSVYSGSWSGRPLVCTGRLNLTAGVDYNTTQSSTMTSEDGTSYTSYHAVDGTDSYSRTLNESQPSWTMTLRPPYYDIHRVNLVLPDTNFSSSDVNISVKVVRWEGLYGTFYCNPRHLLTPPVYNASCNVYAYGYDVRVFAKYRETGPLVIQDAQMFGRERGTGCDPPAAVVGLRYTASDTRFGSTVNVYCDDDGGYYYTGGWVTGYCATSYSQFIGWDVRCSNDENIALGKTVFIMTNSSINVTNVVDDDVTNVVDDDVTNVVDDDVTTCITTNAAIHHIIVLDLAESYEIQTVSASIPENVTYSNLVLTVSRHLNGSVSKTCDFADESWNYLLHDTRTLVFSCYGSPYGRYVTMNLEMYDSTNFDLCEIRTFGRRQHDKPLECLQTDKSMAYKGQMNFTMSGKSCVPWHNVTNLYYYVGDFPEYDVVEAGNKCRNPRNPRSKPWCYTSTSKQWEYCPLPYCRDICSYGKFGDKYAGKIMKTTSGQGCQHWISDSPNEHAFKLYSSFSHPPRDHPYCRNPFTSQTTPWCFTTTPGVRYEACNIPACPTAFGVVKVTVYNATVLGLLKNQEQCFHWKKNKMKSLESKDPTEACSSKEMAVVFCNYMNENNTFYWKYFLIDCVVPTTTPLTSSTTVATSPPATPVITERCPIQTSNGTSVNHGLLCWCAPRYQVSDLAAETEVTVARIRKHLTVDKTTLARQRRLLYSAPDYRTTSVAMGTSSIVIICLVLTCLTMPDISRFIAWMYGKLAENSN